MKLLKIINRLKYPRDLWLFLQILLTLMLLPREIGKRSLPDLLSRIDPGAVQGPRDTLRLEKTVRFIESLLKYSFFRRYGYCLLRSLVLFKFLRRQGWPVTIHFGVRRGRAGDETAPAPAMPVRATPAAHIGITGHSWLMLNGKPFLEAEHQEGAYTETYSYPH